MQNKKRTILVTGAAGFVGWKTSELLLEGGDNVIGIDNLNDYYDVRLKKWRLSALEKSENFKFHKVDIEDFNALERVFKLHRIDAVINLAARAGVRASLEDPFVYASTNVMGTLNLLELCKDRGINKFVLASTSSLYAGEKMPFKETLPVNTPVSPYAATKKGAEALCYPYHFLHGIDISVVRYFTVYGPAGRPDMSVFIFTDKIARGEELMVFGDGKQSRDFTYIDDIARGTIKALKKVGYKVINLGGNKPHELKYMIGLIEDNLGKKAKIKHGPFHAADLKSTWADITDAGEVLGWKPFITLEEGIKSTVEWYSDNENWLKDLEGSW